MLWLYLGLTLGLLPVYLAGVDHITILLVANLTVSTTILAAMHEKEKREESMRRLAQTRGQEGER